MRTYCITGVSGYIGGLLAARLARDSDARVVGIDQSAPARADAIAFHRCDIRAPELTRILGEEKADTLVHLAFYTLPEGDAALARSVNIDGTRNVLAAAAAAGVRRIVLASSAAAYGSHPDNPVPMREEQALRPNDFFYYSWHKAEQERLLAEFLRGHAGVEAVVLRPCVLIGAHINNPTGESLRQKILVYPKGDTTPIQLIHEDDAAEAFYLAATGKDTGVFNVAAAGLLTYPEIARLARKRLLLLPYPLLAMLATAGKWLGLSPVSARTLRFIGNPIVVDASKFSERFGFKPRRDARAAFMAFIEGR